MSKSKIQSVCLILSFKDTNSLWLSMRHALPSVHISSFTLLCPLCLSACPIGYSSHSRACILNSLGKCCNSILSILKSAYTVCGSSSFISGGSRLNSWGL